MGVPDQKNIGANAPIDKYFTNPYGIFVAVSPYLIIMAMREELDAKHIPDGMVGFKFYN